MPSGNDAYHINGNALHSVLYLPVDTSKYLPLHDERLKEIQETFSNGTWLTLQAYYKYNLMDATNFYMSLL